VASTVGDMVAIFSVDGRRFDQGLRQMEQRSRGFAGRTNQTFNQAAFGVQDFIAVLQMGGSNALGRAVMATSNNVQQLASFLPGPIGLILTLGATIGAALIPQLISGAQNTAQLTKNLEESEKALERVIKLETSGVAFERKLGEIDVMTPVDTIHAQSRAIGDEIAEMEAEVEHRAGRLRDLFIQARRAGELGPGVHEDLGFFDERGRLTREITVPNSPLGNALAEEQRRLEDLDDRIERFRRRREGLGERATEAKGFQDALAEQKKLEEAENKRLELTKKLRDEIATPFDEAKKRLDELKQNLIRGEADPKLILGAGQKTIDQFAKQQASGGRSLGFATDAVSAFEQIRAAVRSREDRQTQQIEVLKRQLAALEKLVRAEEEKRRLAAKAPTEVHL
jgi:hypothetical protein